MRFLKVYATVVVCLALFHMFGTVGLAEENKSAWPTHLRVLTGPNGGQWFTMGEPIAQVLSREVRSASSRSGGGVDNIASISARRGDVGFSLQSFIGAAQQKAHEDLRGENAVMMVNLYPQVLYFLVRRDFAEKHGITDVDSLLRLKGPLRFASLRPGTASEFILNLLLRNGYKTSFEQLREQGWAIQFNNYAETADNFVDGQIDCFAYTAGTNVPLIKTMEEHIDVRILPLSKEVLEVMRQKFQTSTYVIDPGDYRSVKEPLLTLGDYTGLIVRKDLPDDLVFAMCQSLWNNKTEIGNVVADFAQLELATALPEGVPVHPGAVKFWNSLKAKKK